MGKKKKDLYNLINIIYNLINYLEFFELHG